MSVRSDFFNAKVEENEGTVIRRLIDQDVVVGDYVLIHIGFAMNKIDEEDALESLKVYEEIIQKM